MRASSSTVAESLIPYGLCGRFQSSFWKLWKTQMLLSFLKNNGRFSVELIKRLEIVLLFS